MDIWKHEAEKWRTSEPLTINRLHFPKEALPMVWQIFHESFASMPDDAKIVPEDYPDGIYHTAGNCKFGYIGMNQTRKATEEEEQIVVKFATEFGRLYQRFLDLQKAEAQTREAQIETALERVRARSMGMQKSDELAEVVNVLFKQFEALDFGLFQVLVSIYDPKNSRIEWWSKGLEDIDLPQRNIIPLIDHPFSNDLLERWKNGQEFYSHTLEGANKKSWEDYLFTQTDLKNFPEEVKTRMRSIEKVYLSDAFMKYGSIQAAGPAPLPNDKAIILKRFAKVLDLAYTRMRDLQNAEAQAREARIEVALERVRSKAMAMHKSEDLHAAVAVVFEELDKLNIGVLRVGISVLNRETRSGNVWLTSIDKGKAVQVSGDESFDIHPLLHGAFEAWLRQEDFYYVLEGEDLTQYYKAVEKARFQLPESQMLTSEKGFQRQYCFVAVYNSGGLFAFRETEFPEEAKTVMKRFAGVFDLTYQRFLDLQKAEAQAREAQIELALERVRAMAMAMHSSEDLSATVNVFFKELKILGITPMRCGVGEMHEETHQSDLVFTTADKQGELYELPGKLKHKGHPVIENIYRYWKLQEEYHPVLQGSDINAYYRVIKSQMTLPDFPDYAKHYGNYFYFKEGFFFAWAEKELSEEGLRISRRFTSVLSLTFRRYKDLKEAEAQAREAKIEAALERVRSKAMAMHSSEDLAETIKTFYQQMGLLNLMPRRCGVGLIDKETHVADLTGMISSEQGEAREIAGKIKLSKHPVVQTVYDNWLLQKEYHPVLRGNEIKEYYELIGSQISLQDYPPDSVQYGYFFYFPEGTVYAWSEKEFADDELKIYRRFTSVLSLTYKRYLDLKQAEAQAREATIEAALERVRYRAMAMQTSNDVGEATSTMFDELDILCIETFRCGIAIIKGVELEVWSMGNTGDGRMVKGVGRVVINQHPLWQLFNESVKRKEDFLYYYLAGKEKEDYVKIISTTASYFMSQSNLNFPDLHFQSYNFEEGGIFSFSINPHSEADKAVMKRFTNVFSLTFRRYQDLKQAEAQAKEATIEAALERVRGKAMAMNDSKDLSSTIVIAFAELKKLGITPLRFGVGLIDKETHKAQLYAATSSAAGDGLALIGWILFNGHPVIEHIYESWIKTEDYFPVLEGEQLRSYYELLSSGLSVPKIPDWQNGEKQYGHFFPHPVSCLYAWAYQPFNETDKKILKRFASIIELTFRRYLELQKSEANARDAVRQASLDRVRAEIASMRTINDLEKITPLIWNELTILGVPFIRCGVFIMDEEQQLIHTFLSTPEGKAIGAFHLSYTTPGNIQSVLSNWRKKRSYIDHWKEACVY